MWPFRSLHCLEHLIDELGGKLLVEQVAHRVDEHAALAPPRKRFQKLVRSQCEIESVFERMARNATKTLGEALGVAVVAATAELSAAAYRVRSTRWLCAMPRAMTV